MGFLDRLRKKNEKKRKENEAYIKHTAEYLTKLDEQRDLYRAQAERCRTNAIETNDSTDAARWTQAAAYWDDKILQNSRSHLNVIWRY